MKTITRLEASAHGYKRYYTGTLCHRGHDSPRYVSTGACIACQRVAQRQYQSQVLRRDLKVFIPIPMTLAYDAEETLHKAVYAFGVAKAAELAEQFPMDRRGRLDPDLQQMLATGAERALHPGGFRAPKVNEDKPYLSVRTVMFDEDGQPIPSAPRQRAVAPPPPPNAPVVPPPPPARNVAPPMPPQAPSIVDDTDVSEADLMAEFERMAK